MHPDKKIVETVSRVRRGPRVILAILLAGLLLVLAGGHVLFPSAGQRVLGLLGLAEAQEKAEKAESAKPVSEPGKAVAKSSDKPDRPDRKDAKPGQTQAKKPAPVTAAVAASRSVPVELRAVGNVESSATVQIKARVDGEVVKVHFKEGQEVRKGDALFSIDPRPYQATLREAQARLERDRALAAKARQDIRRYDELLRKEFISREQHEQVTANSASLDATVRADEAAVESARLQLAYASISSPISGRTGVISSDAGSMIKANDAAPMVVIEQIEPINAAFSVPEANLPAVLERMKAGRPTVTAHPQGAAGAPEKGTLSFVDNAVDMKTGTIRLKGTFENKSRTLWPGQFVNVVLELGRQDGAVLVPSLAVQTGAEGPYVYVIREDKTVEFRKIVSGRAYGDETVIASGLKAGERVVVDGQLRLTPNASVEIKTAIGDPDGNQAESGQTMTFQAGS